VRVTTWNVNGIRAALRKGLPDLLPTLDTDVLLLQEIRALPEQLPKAWQAPEGWHVRWHPAEKKGYAGTAVWSRHPIEEIGRGLDAADPEGRVLAVRTGGLHVVSVYLPSGSSGTEKQARKEAWMARFADWARERVGEREPLWLGGDLNIAHTERDIWNAKGNAKNSGFLPHERDWFTELLGQGWRDVFREHHGDVQGPYSWWSNRGKAREKDRGWRIDYLLGNDAATQAVSDVSVWREAGLQCSDHAPVTVTLDTP